MKQENKKGENKCSKMHIFLMADILVHHFVNGKVAFRMKTQLN
jgi:hypothetical protein